MADTKVYLPKQTVTRGVPGYKGKDIVVVDPKNNRQLSAEADAKASKDEAAKAREADAKPVVASK